MVSDTPDFSSAVERAARAISSRYSGCTKVYAECDSRRRTGCDCRKDAQAALTAAYPELLAENERLRRIIRLLDVFCPPDERSAMQESL